MIAEKPVPLAVGLDATLTPSQTLGEAWLNVARRSPLRALAALSWLIGGRAGFRARFAATWPIVPAELPWNEGLLAWLRAERATGRRIVLATDAPEHWARAVAAELDVFDDIVATASGAKRTALDERFGIGGWDYVGHAKTDRSIWAGARRSYAVDAAKAGARAGGAEVFQVPGAHRGVDRAHAWKRAVRMHQWSKNLLIFAPAILTREAGLLDHLTLSALGFVSFCAMASGTYLVNDALDLPHDRAHPRKRTRPLASGDISVQQVAIVAPLLIAASFASGMWLGTVFVEVLIAYAVLTLAYSFSLKRRSLDVMTLAVLYVLRIVAGSAATSVPLSPWFLAFAVFLFTSFGFAKRANEIAALRPEESDPAGRGYRRSDLGVLVALGSAAAYTAVLVFALYLTSPEVRQMYAHPDVLWLAAFALMGWISRLWLKAHRGGLGDDPVSFAIRDRISLALGAVIALSLAVAALWQ